MPGSFDDLGGVLAAANLLVDPSDESVSPRTLLQALGLGLPVVSCNLDTLRQTPALEAGTGLFVSPVDGAALTQAMLEMLSTPPSAGALAATRQRVLREYGSARMVGEHLQLFERLRGERTR
jgi:glycosyltransferase involved in cell wall biosynthesis